MTTQETNSKTATCMKCGRTLDDGDKFGLCPDCTNKFGTPIIGAGALALGALVKKFGPKAVKLLVSLVKR